MRGEVVGFAQNRDCFCPMRVEAGWGQRWPEDEFDANCQPKSGGLNRTEAFLRLDPEHDDDPQFGEESEEFACELGRARTRVRPTFRWSALIRHGTAFFLNRRAR